MPADEAPADPTLSDFCYECGAPLYYHGRSSYEREGRYYCRECHDRLWPSPSTGGPLTRNDVPSLPPLIVPPLLDQATGPERVKRSQRGS